MKPDDKVYGAYFKSKEPVLYFNELKRVSGLSDSSLTNTLNKLVAQGVLAREETKSNTYYKIHNKDLFALKFSELAMRKFDDLSIGIRIPLQNFLKDIPKEIFTIILFGSSSRKEEREGSDIDILVVSNEGINLKRNKKEAELTSKYPITVFRSTIPQFLDNDDDIIVQAKKTGFPIYKEQNFYEVLLDEY